MNASLALRSFDLNLLRVLEALLEEQSVTRAANRLGRSQPAVSNSLARLRKTLDDELLVARGKAMVLTPRARALRASVREILALAERSLFGEAAFHPRSASGVFRLSMPDRLTLAILPPLLQRIKRSAPAMDLRLITAAQSEAIGMLDEEVTDVALGWFDDLPAQFRSELLSEESSFCVFRRNHPITRMKFTIDAVLSFPHLVVTGRGRTAAIFDDLLKGHGKKRRAHLTVSNFSAVPELLTRSDMIGIFTQLAADTLVGTSPLVKRPVPIAVATIATYLVWHARNDRDAGHRWLREQVRRVYDAL